MNNLTNDDVSIIVAVDLAGGFAKDYQIPWKGEPYAKEDLKQFQQLTKGHVVVMGRHTYEEILVMKHQRTRTVENSPVMAITSNEPLLSNRTSYVLSRNPEFEPIGAIKKDELIKVLQDEQVQGKTVFILGGQKLFIESFSRVKNVYLTIVKHYFNCDKIFPTQILTRHFAIKDGKETDELYFVHYVRK
jgi:dihydrofolate reductase